MHHDMITFQLATHFLPKIALRLEYLYGTVNQACEENHPIIHHYALKNIIEIIRLIEKPELKSRFLKELIRIERILNKATSPVALELQNSFHNQIQLLSHTAGLFGEGIHHNPFLQSIRLTQSSHQNDHEMYSPQLLLWLAANSALRQRDLAVWLNHLRPLNSTVSVYMSLLRDTAEFKQINLLNGFYQCPLPPKTVCHLILLRIDKSLGIAPRMQLGHHGLSLRLFEAATMKEIREKLISYSI